MGVEERDRHAWLRLTSVSEKDTLERESRKIGSITPPQTYSIMYVVGWDGGKIKIQVRSKLKENDERSMVYNM